MGLASFNRQRRIEKLVNEKREEIVEKDFESLKLPELKLIAEQLEIEFPSSIRKADLIVLLQQHTSTPEDNAEGEAETEGENAEEEVIQEDGETDGTETTETTPEDSPEGEAEAE